MAVRRESVLLTLEDHFTTGMAKAAAATAVLNRNLHDLDGSSTSASDGIKQFGDETDRTSTKTRNGGAEIDRFSGRLSLLRDVAVTLGPALVPLGGAAVTGVAGLAAQFGVAAGAAGVAALAFNGVGDALKSVRDYELEPTAENLDKMNLALENVGEAGADFVMFLSSVRPQISELQNIARAGIFPGLEEGLRSMLDMGPQFERIVANIAGAMGELASRAGEALSGDRFAAFFNYVENSAIPLLTDMGRTFGFVVEGLANMLVAFDPLSKAFSNGLTGMAEAFAEWSRGLGDNQAFQEFVSYLSETGPQAVAAIGAIVKALAGIVEAAAPVGRVVLPILTGLADALGALAGSPLGTPLLTLAAAMATFNRAAGLANTALSALGGTATNTGMKLSTSLKLGGVVTGILLVQDAVNSLGNSLSDADLSRNLEAFARGADVADFSGLGFDIEVMASAMRTAEEPLLELTSGFGLLGDTARDKAAANIDKIDQALAALVEGGRADEAAEAFQRLMEIAESQGVSVDEAAAQFDAYDTALGNASESSEAVAGAAERASEAIKAETETVQENVEAMKAKRDASLAAFDAETQWRQSLVAAREAAKDNTAGIRGNSEAALENRSKLSDLVAAWNNQSEAVRNNNARFREARQAFIETAEAMGVPQEEARKLAARLLEIPNQKVIKTEVETAAAQDRILALRRSLSAIPDETVNVWVTRREVNGGGMGPQERQYASGGLVRGPGTATSDSIPARLSDGEFVINAAATTRHRSLLEQINAHQYADGGYVTNNVDQRRYDQRVSMPSAPAPISVSASVELAPLRQEIRLLRTAVERADRNNRLAARETGQAVGDAINHAAAKAARR